MLRRVVVFLLVSVLVVGEFPAQAAGVAAVGVVTQASGASIASATVSTGATVYDGDSLATNAEGLLRVRSGAAQFYLAGQSGVRMHSAPSGALVELTAGRLVFSSANAAAMNIEVSQATIRPAGDMATAAQIFLVNPRTIEVQAKRGALQFSYKDETELIPEGASARILLDPTDDEVAKATPTAAPRPFPDQKPPRPPRRRRKAFFIFWGGVTAGLAIPILIKALESPNKP